METMHKLKEMLCNELRKLVNQGEMSASLLDAFYKLVVTIEKIDRIEEIEGFSHAEEEALDYENMGEVVERMLKSTTTPLKDKDTLRKAIEILNR